MFTPRKLDEKRIPAFGFSMFPSIPNGSTLRVVTKAAGQISVGDVVCYLDEIHPLVAHRVVDIRIVENAYEYLTRGDSLPNRTWVPHSTVVGVVTEVRWKRATYRPDGKLGKLIKRVVLSTGFDKAQRLAHKLMRLRRFGFTRRTGSALQQHRPSS